MMNGLHMNYESPETRTCPGYKGERAPKCPGEFTTVCRTAKRCPVVLGVSSGGSGEGLVGEA